MIKSGDCQQRSWSIHLAGALRLDLAAPILAHRVEHPGPLPPACSRSARPWRPGPSSGHLPAPPALCPWVPSFSRAASSTARLGPRRRSSRHTPARCSYRRPGLLLPDLDRRVVAFDGPPGRLLPGPAVTLQKQPRALHCVAHMEQPTDQRLDPRQRPPLISPALDQWSTFQLPFQPRDLRVAEPRPPGDPFDRTTASPRSRHWWRHRSSDRSLTRSAAAISLFFSPPSKRSTACSRTRSLAALPASVNPPPCAYLTLQGYRSGPVAVRQTAPTSPNQAQKSYFTTYRVDGHTGGPVPARPPVQVGHYEDTFRRAEGHWQLARRTLFLAFAGPTDRLAPAGKD